MLSYHHNTKKLRDYILSCQEIAKEPEWFFANILKGLSDEHIMKHLDKEFNAGKLSKKKYDRLKENLKWTKLEGFLELKEILVKVFEKFKEQRENIEELFSYELR